MFSFLARSLPSLIKLYQQLSEQREAENVVRNEGGGQETRNRVERGDGGVFLSASCVTQKLRAVPDLLPPQ